MVKKFEEKGYPSELTQEAFMSHMNPPAKQKSKAERSENNTVSVSNFNKKYRSV